MIIEPGTSAVSTPAAPITPTNHGGNVCIERRNSDRSMFGPVSPGTFSTAAKPTKKTNARMSW